jgi:hypothetical protein
LLFASFITTVKAQFNFGAGVTLLDLDVIGIQGKAMYEINDTWRGAGAFSIYLSNGPDYSIDLDAQYKLLEVSDNFNLAPIGGINILGGNGGTNIGLNLGAFIDFVPDNSYHIYIEPKFVFNDGTFLTVSGGILF